jgi:hypothetical protein
MLLTSCKDTYLQCKIQISKFKMEPEWLFCDGISLQGCAEPLNITPSVVSDWLFVFNGWPQ